MSSFSAAFKGKEADLLNLIALEDGSPLLVHLKAKAILGKFQIDTIRACPTNVDRVDKMMSLLERNDDSLFKPFVQVLRECGCTRAADLIDPPPLQSASNASTVNIEARNTTTGYATASAPLRGQTDSSVNTATTSMGFLNFSTGSVESTRAYEESGDVNTTVDLGLATPANNAQGHGAAETRVDPVPTVMFGELQKLDKIAEGGFGIVFRGWHQVFKDIAYKQLKVTILQAESRTGKQLKQEAAAHTLRHPNIVILLAMVFEKEHYGVVFEYVKFGGLDVFVDTYDVGWFGLMSFAGDIARGLTYLHGKTPTPVVHGDIKIQNALVGDGFVAKICDFGLSKWKVYSSVNTGSKSGRPGTVTHIPPETWGNISAQRTVKFDVYSFGVLLWELFSHKTPFEEVVSSPQLVSLAVLRGERPAPVDAIRGEAAPFMPDNMFQIVMNYMERCWAQNAANRPPIAEVSGSFDRFLQQNNGQVEAEKTRLSAVTAQHRN